MLLLTINNERIEQRNILGKEGQIKHGKNDEKRQPRRRREIIEGDNGKK